MHWLFICFRHDMCMFICFSLSLSYSLSLYIYIHNHTRTRMYMFAERRRSSEKAAPLQVGTGPVRRRRPPSKVGLKLQHDSLLDPNCNMYYLVSFHVAVKDAATLR